MTITALMATITKNDGALWLENGKVKYRLPTELVNHPENATRILEQLRANRDAVRAALEQQHKSPTHPDITLEPNPLTQQTTQPKLALVLTPEFRPKPLPLHLEKFARAARADKLPLSLADLVVSHVGWWFVTSDPRELEALEELHQQHYGTVQA